MLLIIHLLIVQVLQQVHLQFLVRQQLKQHQVVPTSITQLLGHILLHIQILGLQQLKHIIIMILQVEQALEMFKVQVHHPFLESIS